MKTVLTGLIAFTINTFRSRAAMQMEILALRHQLTVYQRRGFRPRIKPPDRILWSWLSRVWSGWREALVIVQPKTVMAWRRRKFREHWTKLIRSGKPGRPTVSKEVRELIRQMSSSNPLWGAPRIVGELRKIGIDVAKKTFFACLMGEEDRRIFQIIKWDHPFQTREFVDLLLSLPIEKLEVAMEPSGVYGDCLRNLLGKRGVKVYLVSAKRSHDAAEVYDGVPSTHDAKSARRPAVRS